MNTHTYFQVYQRNALTLAVLGIIGIAFLFPIDASAKVRRPHFIPTASGQFSIDAQGGQRKFDFSMTQLSNQCSVKNGQVMGCNGGGVLKYTDDQNNAYAVNVQYTNRQGNNIYFAGPVFSASQQDQVGNWLYGHVVDQGNIPPRTFGNRNQQRDQVSGVFTNEDIARQNVALQAQTGGDYYGVSRGNVDVRIQQHYQRAIRFR